MSDRDPYYGRPYYCDTCGAGWNEYGGCEEVVCQLESELDAKRRQQRRRRVGSDSKRAQEDAARKAGS